jgi:hypothetical protein
MNFDKLTDPHDPHNPRDPHDPSSFYPWIEVVIHRVVAMQRLKSSWPQIGGQ